MEKTLFDRGKSMEQENLKPAFLRCRAEHCDAVTAMYARVLTELERTVNYPKMDEGPPRRRLREGSD